MKSQNDRTIRVQLKTRRSSARIVIHSDARKYMDRFGDYREFDAFVESETKVGLAFGGEISIHEYHLMEVKPRREKPAGRKARRRKVRSIRRHESQMAMMEAQAELRDQCKAQPQADCVTATDGLGPEDLFWYENDPCELLDADGDHIDWDDDEDFIGDLGDWEPSLSHY